VNFTFTFTFYWIVEIGSVAVFRLWVHSLTLVLPMGPTGCVVTVAGRRGILLSGIIFRTSDDGRAP